MGMASSAFREGGRTWEFTWCCQHCGAPLPQSRQHGSMLVGRKRGRTRSPQPNHAWMHFFLSWSTYFTWRCLFVCIFHLPSGLCHLHLLTFTCTCGHARLAKEDSSLKCSESDGTYKTDLGDQIKQEDRAHVSVIHPRSINTCNLCKTLVFHPVPESHNILVIDFRT